MATNKEININGVMTPVTEFSHTAQEIDDATTRALEGGAIDQLLAGKAPDGYGLGGIGKQVTDMNNAKESGFYSAIGSTNLPPNVESAQYGSVLVLCSNADRVTQVYFQDVTGGTGAIAVRRLNGNGWSQWEFINPPMKLGVEYRTTERYQGKPVYVKLVNFGAGANNGEKGVEHGASNAIVIDYGGYATNGNSALSVPWISHSTLSVSSTVIVMTADANYSGYSVYVWIKYYKTTD